MTMAHDDEILEDSKDADDHEMSIVDDNNSSNNRTEKEWHINLFGEIVHDQPEDHEMKIGKNSFKSSLRIPLKCPLSLGLVPNKTATVAGSSITPNLNYIFSLYYSLQIKLMFWFNYQKTMLVNCFFILPIS